MLTACPNFFSGELDHKELTMGLDCFGENSGSGTVSIAKKNKLF
jgi:hypothetical protein